MHAPEGMYARTGGDVCTHTADPLCAQQELTQRWRELCSTTKLLKKERKIYVKQEKEKHLFQAKGPD